MTQVPNYAVPPGTRASVRQGINAVLAALRDDNAGPTAPPNPGPGMMWLDTSTTPPTPRRRNVDNTAWEAVGIPFTPVQQGGGIGQGTNKVFIGWAGSDLHLTVDQTNIGRFQIVTAGQVSYFALSMAPRGWLKANGALLSRTTFADLFAAIGTTFGAGDGSTTFQLPDLRGEFLRVWDDGKGVDGGRQFGQWQNSAVQEHRHGSPNGSISGGYQTQSNGAGSFNNGTYNVTGGPNIPGLYNETGLVSGALTSNETRPRNIALLACIKF